MGRTNIRKSWELIERAGNQSDEIAVIPDLENLSLHIFGRNFSQTELSEFLDPIRHGTNNCWIKRMPKKDDSSSRAWYPVKDVPDVHKIPQLNISQGLKDWWFADRFDTDQLPRQHMKEQDLVFLMVVHGKNGALLPKLVVRWDLKGAAQALMEAAQDGYSVVFSGAAKLIHWRSWTHTMILDMQKPSLMRVDSLEALEDLNVVYRWSNKMKVLDRLPVLC